MVLIQTTILLVFTFVDPPLKTEILELKEGEAGVAVSPIHHILCEHDSNAFYYTEAIFGALVIFLGCCLAYQSRNLGEEFGEAKPLAFAMYNIALAGTLIAAILLAVDMERDAQMLLIAIGVFWGTVLSSTIFVVPRVLKTQYYHSQFDYNSRSVGTGGGSRLTGSAFTRNNDRLNNHKGGHQPNRASTDVTSAIPNAVEVAIEATSRPQEDKSSSFNSLSDLDLSNPELSSADLVASNKGLEPE